MFSFVLLLSLFPAAFGANILGFFSITSISHQVVYRNLMLELNRRGHNVTVITPDPIKDPNLKNYREIDMSFFYEIYNRKMVKDSKRLRIGLMFPELLYTFFTEISMEMCHSYYSSPAIQGLLRENPKFDLFIVEFGFNPCFYALAKLSGNKYMGMWSFQTHPVVHSNIGNPIDASYLPDVNFPFMGKMSFFQRLRTVLFQCFMWALYRYIMNEQTTIARKYLGEDTPHLNELERNLSVMLVNAHFTMSFPRPNVPNLIEVGGPAFHIIGKKPKPLPKDIKDFVDDAPYGVIYFSLGTNVKTNNMTSKEEEILIESFKRIKQKVLWKWENENLKLNLKNVMKAKWFPQIDILAHPNVKAFVTQAGLQSVSEAIEYHVPMITMPFFADQNHNARKMELEGASINLDYDSINVEDFTRALNEIVYNKKYKENIVRFSALVKDQPIPPLEKAVWWTEYVIRHNGAPHLRSAAVTMPWYQYLMLDVLGVLFLAIFLTLYAIYLTLKALLRLLFKSNKSKKD